MGMRLPATGFAVAPWLRGGNPVCWVNSVPRRGVAGFVIWLDSVGSGHFGRAAPLVPAG